MNIRCDGDVPPVAAFPPWQPEPGRPGQPRPAPGIPSPGPAPAGVPARGWPQQGEWPGRLYERLLDQRIVMAHGYLDEETATRLSAQLLTLDAEGGEAIRLELQNLDASLPAALTVMGVLDMLRAPVTAYAGGRVSGPALGVLAAARRRLAYPSALFALAEPVVGFEGTVRSVTAHQEQVQSMLGDLYRRLAAVTGRPEDEIRGDAQRQRTLTTGEAIAYGLVEGYAGQHEARPVPPPG